MWAEIEVTEGTLQQTALPHTLTTTELESTRREWTPCWKATSMVAEPSRGQMYISHHKGWVSFLVELAPGAQIHCSAKVTGLSTNSTFKVSYEHYDLSHANSFCKVSAVYSISWSSLEYQIPRAHHPQAHQCYIRNLSLNYFVIRDAFKHSKTNSACNGTQPCKLSVGSMPSSYLLLATPKQGVHPSSWGICRELCSLVIFPLNACPQFSARIYKAWTTSQGLVCVFLLLFITEWVLVA